jgi:hypothetical protein
LFIPEKSQRETQKFFKMLLSEGLNEKLKIKVTDANGNMHIVECFVTLSVNKLIKGEGLILSINKQQNHE